MKNLAYKYTRVEESIKNSIRQGEIVDKLPGERVLARDLGVSYMTVRKAVSNLVAEGLLYKVPARGTFIQKRGFIRNLIFRANIGLFR